MGLLWQSGWCLMGRLGCLLGLARFMFSGLSEVELVPVCFGAWRVMLGSLGVLGLGVAWDWLGFVGAGMTLAEPS